MGIERRGMIVRKEFSDLLDLYLRDPDKIRPPARTELAALDSLELSKEVTSNLDDQTTRREIVERYYIDHGKPPPGNGNLPGDAHRATQAPPPLPPPSGPPPGSDDTDRFRSCLLYTSPSPRDS